MSLAGQVTQNHLRGGRRHGHPIKAASTAVLCRVFSVVQGTQEADRENEGILERRGGFGCAQADGEPPDERDAGREGGAGWLM